MTEEKLPEGHEKVLLVYLGVRVNADNKIIHAWRELTDVSAYVPMGMEIEQERWYAKQLVRSATPGAIYEFQQEVGPERRSVYPGTANYVCRYHDKDVVARWQALNLATEREHRSKKAEKKAVKERVDLELLSPFRDAYRAARGSAQRRALLLAEVIRYITS